MRESDGLLVSYGGKARIADQIVPHFPRGPSCYLEPYMGGLGVFCSVPENLYRVRVINDLNKGLVTFYRVLRTRPDDLLRVCRLTPYALDEQRSCRDSAGDPDPSTPEGELELARRVWVRQRQNFGGRQGPGAGWRRGTPQQNLASAAAMKLEEFHAFARRMLSVEINNTDALELIEDYSKPDVAIYLDPPYFPEERATNNDYQHEMSPEQHVLLAEKAHAAAAAGALVAISGYGNETYDALYSDWRRVEFQHTVSSTNFVDAEARSRTEVLWMSYPEHLELRHGWGAIVQKGTARERAVLKHFRREGSLK